MPTVALTTLGCKLNFAETSTIGKQFLDRGYSVVRFGDQADVTVINTCSVTGRADRECRQLIRRARRIAPNGTVIVTGCYAQLDPETVASIDGVDYVLGTQEKFSVFRHTGSPTRQEITRVIVSPAGAVDDFGPAYSTEAGNRTRAFLKVQDGCDFHCTFCTIPRARGGSRSQSIDACLQQASELVGRGYREIVLTGVNVGDYGRKDGGLLVLLRELVQVRGMERLRVSSIEPNLLTDPLIEFIAAEDVMCKHVHVPLQSGSDTVLHAMRRRYTREHYAGRMRSVREKIKGCGIGIDVIVGFPGEGEREFEETHRFLEDLPLTYLHVFTYSERPETPAASFAGRVSPAERARRSEVLRQLGMKKKKAFQETLVGMTLPVLVEAEEGEGCRCGFTGNYVRVALPAESAEGNSIVDVAITGVDGDRCTGVIMGGRSG